MDEKEYKNVYNEVNDVVCPFEKAIFTRRYACNNLIRRYIGEREAAGCSDPKSSGQCEYLLQVMRQKASFALQSSASGTRPLVHAKEIRVQCGGLSGMELKIQANFSQDNNDTQLLPSGNESLPAVKDIKTTIKQCIEKYSDFDNMPWPEIVQAISRFSGRKSKKRRSRT